MLPNKKPRGRLKPVRVIPAQRPLVGPQGPQGTPGAMGAVGVGLQGVPGAPGAPPEHRWVGDEIQFKNPDGTWGKRRNLKGDRGFVGGGTVGQHHKYYEVDVADYTITKTEPGMNIFGVTYSAGAVNITLPESIPLDRTIIINDETGNASSNNITVLVPTA